MKGETELTNRTTSEPNAGPNTTGVVQSGAVYRMAVARSFGLTVPQVEILELFAEGMTSYEIGEELGISRDTVHGRAQQLRRKIGAKTITEAVAIGFKNHFLK